MRMVRQTSLALSVKSSTHEGKADTRVPVSQLFSDEEPGPGMKLQRTQTARGIVTNIESEGLTTELAAELLKKFGRNELPEKKKPKWLIVSDGSSHRLLA